MNKISWHAALILVALAVMPLASCADHQVQPQPDQAQAQEVPPADTQTPAPAQAAVKPPAPAVDPENYTIIAGDVLQVTVWKEDGLDREVLVLPNGDITFPMIGTFKAQGQTPTQVQDTIKKKFKKLIPDASVTVAVKAALGHTVSVLGQVNKPGEFVLNHRTTALQALSEAGGLTPFASEGKIIVVRHSGDQSTSITIPYHAIANGDDLDQDIVLQAGDVIMVPTSKLF